MTLQSFIFYYLISAASFLIRWMILYLIFCPWLNHDVLLRAKYIKADLANHAYLFIFAIWSKKSDLGRRPQRWSEYGSWACSLSLTLPVPEKRRKQKLQISHLNPSFTRYALWIGWRSKASTVALARLGLYRLWYMLCRWGEYMCAPSTIVSQPAITSICIRARASVPVMLHYQRFQSWTPWYSARKRMCFLSAISLSLELASVAYCKRGRLV
jgi:hypothetical protein